MQHPWTFLTTTSRACVLAASCCACGSLGPAPVVPAQDAPVAQHAQVQEAPPVQRLLSASGDPHVTDLYGSYGEADPVAVTLSVDIGDGPFVAGEQVTGACTARNARGVPVAASVNWGIEHKLPPQTGPKRRPTEHAGDHFTVTAGGLIGAKAGTFELLCEQRGEDGEVLARSPVRTVVIEPAAASHWRVELHEQGPCFDQASRLPMSWQAWDDFGNPVQGLQVQLRTEPPSNIARDDSGGFLLLDEGDFALTLTATGPRGEVLPAIHKRINIDSTAPTIEIVSPARGAVVQSDDFNLMLTGKIVDRRNAIVSFEIEGQPQPLSTNADGTGPLEHQFSVPYHARWGLNVVHAKVADACGNSRMLLQSFLQSDAFAPLSTRTTGDKTVVQDRLPGAVKATLDERLWDQGDPAAEHDLRHLIEVAVANGGLNERLPEHLASWPASHVLFGDGDRTRGHDNRRLSLDDFGVDVWRDGPLQMQAPEVESLRIEEGGFVVRMNFRDIDLPVAIDGRVGWNWMTLRAAVVAKQVTIEAKAKVHMGEQGPVVDICEDCVSTAFVDGGPALHIRSQEPTTPAWQRRGAGVLEWLLGRSTRGLAAGLQQRVRTDMTHEMERMLRGLKLQHALELPAPLRGRLTIQSGLDNIALHRTREAASCDIDLYSAIEVPIDRNLPAALVAAPLPLSHGPIRAPRRAAATAPALVGDGSTFAISVADDLLNQIAWSMWAGGALDADDLRNAQEAARADTDDAGRNLLEAAHLNVYFTSPPVIMPSTSPDELRIGVGDVYAEIEIDLYKMNGLPTPPGYKNLAATGYFSLRMRAKLGVDKDARSLRIVKLERSHAQVHVLKSPSVVAVPAVTHWLEKMVRLTMPHHLAQAMSISVPLPNLQIGLLPGVPDHAAWSLEDVSLMRPPSAQETILRGRFGPLPSPGPAPSEAAPIAEVVVDQ